MLPIEGNRAANNLGMGRRGGQFISDLILQKREMQLVWASVSAKCLSECVACLGAFLPRAVGVLDGFRLNQRLLRYKAIEWPDAS